MGKNTRWEDQYPVAAATEQCRKIMYLRTILANNKIYKIFLAFTILPLYTNRCVCLEVCHLSTGD